jgi:hypothetical protein
VCLALVGRKGWERRFAGGIMYVIGAVVVVASWKTRICTNVLYARARGMPTLFWWCIYMLMYIFVLCSKIYCEVVIWFQCSIEIFEGAVLGS